MQLNQRHYHLLASRWVCLVSGKVTATVTPKHLKTVRRRRKRRASDINVTKSIQDVQPHVLLVTCKFPAPSPA